MRWREVKPLIYNPNASNRMILVVLCCISHFMIYIQYNHTYHHHIIYILQNDKDMFGLESKPHTTLLYGLHDNVDITDVANKLDNIEYSECGY
jgi:hypothetical protein